MHTLSESVTSFLTRIR